MNLPKKQLLGLNSVQKIVQLVGELSEKIPLPEGVVLRTEDEIVIWGQCPSSNGLRQMG